MYEILTQIFEISTKIGIYNVRDFVKIFKILTQISDISTKR